MDKQIYEKNGYIIREATLKDVPRILEIYTYYVEDTAITYEYTVPTLSEMESRMKHTLEKYPYYVASKDGQVVGYCYAGAYHPRAAYQWNAELSIYLDKDMRGCGLGRIMYDIISDRLKKLGYLNLYACIAHAPHEDEYLKNDSEAFHRKLGFKKISHSHSCGYKFDRWYDMVWMEKRIARHMTPPKPIKNN